MNAWELVMEYFINKKRTEEKHIIWDMNWRQMFSEFILLFFPSLAMFLILYSYAEYKDSRADITHTYEALIINFTLIEVYRKKRVSKHYYSLTKDFLNRVENFMVLDEYKDISQSDALAKGEVLIKDASFSWHTPQIKKVFQ